MVQLLQIVNDSINVTTEITEAIRSGNAELIISKLIETSLSVGKSLLMALFIFVVGRLLIRLAKRIMNRVMTRRNVEISVQGFLNNVANIVLNILLLISVIGALGINTTSFAALLASAGVAIGMALSGNLQNFAGGLIILLFKPYKVGDWVEAQGTSGKVIEIQMMHTLLLTGDNKTVFVPNGAMSSGTIINYSKMETRRLDWTVGVEYGTDIDLVKTTLQQIINEDSRILKEPACTIEVGALDQSCINMTIRVWVKSDDYWTVHFDMNRKIYDEFNKAGIIFPFPQLTIHQA